jgi:hypothetical protein
MIGAVRAADPSTLGQRLEEWIMRTWLGLGGGLLALPAVIVGLFIWRTARDPRQVDFRVSRATDPPPDGPYRGTVPGYEPLAAGWYGKQFAAANATGTNRVRRAGGLREAFPFRTYVAPGLTDPQAERLRVDYDLPTNPLWLRVCADELVQLSPGHYLGLSYIRLLPGRPFPMLFFELQQEEPSRPATEPAAAALRR